ncbi:aldehyde dehydrogenase family protein [Halobellus ruber]|uniref:Aldehyde dehydrogenase n=1 Tax=Halobellus ruber TaxID=2761102 RepID=A0A7J9SHP9_9EURY|nr:aldehyde dehydrogenase family protein [Halobellus ruber]MBB6646012.1 aldehyde dehydrogenase [Halobellus ruber]
MRQLYIDGEWRDSAADPLACRSPVDDSTLGSVSRGTPKHVEEAVVATTETARTFREMNVHDRADAIRSAMDRLAERADEIVETMARETGKPLSEARTEVESAIDSGRSYAADAVRLNGEVTRSTFEARLNFTQREPYGPAGVITPWNYPFEIPTDHLSAALVTGNPVTWNPASEATLTATYIAEAFAETSLPEGAFNFVPGPGSSVGAALSTHDAVRLVAFTGSTDVGQRIAATAAERSAQALLELGGKDPVLVLDDADVEAAADAIVTGSNYNCGQSCSGTERVIATDAVYDDVVDAVTERTGSLVVGDPLDEATDVGPPINDDTRSTVREHVSDAVDAGARVTAGGSVGQRYCEPTVLADVTPGMRVATKETFGPVTPIIRAADTGAAVEIANDTKYGLQAAVFTESLRTAHRVVNRLRSGGVVVNGTNNVWEHQLPFGGFKQSGSGGEYKGTWHLEGMTQVKSVAIDYGN